MRERLDQHRLFLIKKTEKLSAVTYMLSGFFDDREPLKWRLRTLGLELIDTAGTLIGPSGIVHEQGRRKLCVDLLSLKVALQLSKTAEYVSEMNYTLLERELDEFVRFLKEQLPEALHLNSGREALLGPATPTLSVLTTANPQDKQDDIKDKLAQSSTLSESALSARKSYKEVERVHSKRQNSKEQSKGHMGHENSISGGVKDITQARHTLDLGGGISRSEVILSYITGGREYTIKDIVLHVPGVSEKTIQRDLQALVSAGLLRRKGERRWSRYFR
ncbi:MAG: hypothetical protein COV10_04865 [Candidatus Vogelbacteria bacterium CG10_big_fil_rev_8_21_14_0_10_51_16]|uniref:HTH deoR-type domain-containing protein n=1 Tax=Candidatus Vogelbacteria bacterium CG10_big_fil_rev_8_21_14_0_10_51_16 TaxID=1975045 RepID=A0A2H0RD21_9BACT|nr:MAG: hypothetical protein COV10_04865 [Candidatus Vogelbacteria bacterium CG10_big_fil_rev_8_21_14_0_10_51_16]